MDKEKKFCFCITRRRVISAVILVASVLNLIIVGAAFDVTFPEAALTATASPTVAVITRTFSAPTATQGIPLPVTAASTDTPTPTATFTATPTNTFTATATDTSTPTNTALPTPTACIPMYRWPVYLVQRGDTLSSIASRTGSTANELMLANCLLDSRILAGGKLYVPRLPIIPPTVTPTPTNTPTVTPTIFVDTPTSFTLYQPMDCKPPDYVFIAVMATDPEGVLSVTIQLYTKDNSLIGQQEMIPNGSIYSASGTLGKQYTVYDVDHYLFTAVDSFQNKFDSQAYTDRSGACIG
jgi:LysM repeat protein